MKTGRQASEETERYLLGQDQRDAFVAEFKERGERFEEPIKKTKTMNFALFNFKDKNKSAKAEQVTQAKGT